MQNIPDRTDAILNNLEVGKLAKPKMYNNLLKRVNSGEVLTKKELETFEALDTELRAMYLPHLPDQTAPKKPEKEAPDKFESVLKVEKHLTEEGWKVKKSALYNAVKAHKLIPDARGHFTQAEVDRYALANLKKADGSIPKEQLSEADKIAMEAADARRRRELAQAAILESKLATLQGSLVPRYLFETELAARAVVFRSDGENFFRSQAAVIVNVVSGDPAKIPDLVAFCLEAYEQQLARYLQEEEFKVDASVYERIFEKAGKDEQDREEIDA